MSNNMDHQLTPLFSGVKSHVKNNPTPFHIPGHKRGLGVLPEFREFLGDNVFASDLINLQPLDDLHNPHGIIKEAEELAADAFGADKTFFSVQGTSTPIIAMIMGVCGPGDKIILPRNVHKSIISALILSGATPIFLPPFLDQQWGIHHGTSLQNTKKIVELHADAKALLVINPTYYGVANNLKKIVELAHEKNIPVLVDEAHGTHFHFHPSLPLSAMEAGADMAASSVHKLGGSMTQSSILNMQNERISKDRVKKFMSLLTTTSTSYILLSSLDTARKQLKLHYSRKLEETIILAKKARVEINNIPSIHCMGEEIIGKNDSIFALDPLKLLIHVRELGLTGHQVENWLRTKANIEVELSDIYNILCIITPADSEDQIEHLIASLKKLVSEKVDGEQANWKNALPVVLPPIPTLAMSPREAFYAKTESVPIELAANRVIAESIMVYPPGIPIMLPGEIITPNILQFINHNIESGLSIQGPEDSQFQNIRVVFK